MANKQPQYVACTWQIPKDLGHGNVLADDCVINGPRIGWPVTVNFDPTSVAGFVAGFDPKTRTVTMELDSDKEELIQRQARDFSIGYSAWSSTADDGKVQAHEVRIHDVTVIPTPPAEKNEAT